MGAYLRYEVIRSFRNRRFLLFSLGFPMLLFLVVGGANRGKSLDGIPFALYYMTGMAAWGTMIAVISCGTRIAAERQIGWTRQLRITPLRAGAYLQAKIVGGYLMALLTMVVLYLAGAALGVRLSAGQWATMTLLLLAGLIPFAVLGITLGHLLRPDSLGPATGGITALLALVSGAYGPLSASGAYLDIVRWIPSYWLVQAGAAAFGGSGWPPAQAWIVLAVWTAVFGWLAVLAFRRDTQRVT